MTRKKPKQGPPFKAKKDRRIIRNVVKTSEVEQKKLTANAKKAGYTSVVVWLRELGLRG